MSSAWPAMPCTDASWSMRPHGTPVARCSARWHSAAMSPVAPSASASATSSDALDESPAPMGSVEVTCPVKPVTGRTSATMASTNRWKRSSAASDVMTTSSPPRSPSTVVPRSTAIGSTSPPA